MGPNGTAEVANPPDRWGDEAALGGKMVGGAPPGPPTRPTSQVAGAASGEKRGAAETAEIAKPGRQPG